MVHKQDTVLMFKKTATIGQMLTPETKIKIETLNSRARAVASSLSVILAEMNGLQEFIKNALEGDQEYIDKINNTIALANLEEYIGDLEQSLSQFFE